MLGKILKVDHWHGLNFIIRSSTFMILECQSNIFSNMPMIFIKCVICPCLVMYKVFLPGWGNLGRVATLIRNDYCTLKFAAATAKNMRSMPKSFAKQQGFFSLTTKFNIGIFLPDINCFIDFPGLVTVALLYVFAWCSGYHICLTHRRSQVRALVRTRVFNRKMS